MQVYKCCVASKSARYEYEWLADEEIYLALELKLGGGELLLKGLFFLLLHQDLCTRLLQVAFLTGEKIGCVRVRTTGEH